MIFRAVLASLAAIAAAPILLAVVVAGLPLAVVSWGTRTLAGLLAPRAAPAKSWMEFEPIIGWRPIANLDIYHRDLNGDVFHLRTGSDGWRKGSCSLSEADVAVFGDSFAFGSSVDDGSFFGELEGGVRVKAIGAPGYNMAQEYLLMERLGEKLRGKMVVWFIYLGNDLDDNMRPNNVEYRMPFVRPANDGWEIVTEHVTDEPWPFKSHRLNYETWVEICTPSDLSRRALDACSHLLARGDALCRSHGADLAVVTIPDLSGLVLGQIQKVLDGSPDLESAYDPRIPDRHIAATCSVLGCSFVALADRMSNADYREHDVHWSGSGHRKVYRTIEELFNNRQSPARPDGTTVDLPRKGRKEATTGGQDGELPKVESA